MMKVIFIDAKNALFRWGWVGRNLTDDQGNSTGAVYGVLNAVVSLRKHNPESKFVVCWDGPRNDKTWRSKLFPEYKTNRAKGVVTVEMKKRREDLLWQIDVLKRVFKMIDIPQCEDIELEADDWIGILAQAVMDDGYDALVYTNDHDYLQLLRRGVTLCSEVTGKCVDEKFIKAKYKCDGENLLKLRALLGDKSDGIPRAVSGVGEVAAAKYIGLGIDPSLPRFTDLPREVRLAAPRLEAAWARIHLNYRLMRIPSSARDLELPSAVQERTVLEVRRVLKALETRSKRTQDGYNLFVKLLTDLDLRRALENRHELWKVQL